MPDRPKRFRPIGIPERPKRRDVRPNAGKRGYDARWRKARLRYLATHPLCVYCEKQGRKVAARCVDHIVPHDGNQELFWDMENNWQALCTPCHSRKTAKHDKGFGHVKS